MPYKDDWPTIPTKQQRGRMPESGLHGSHQKKTEVLHPVQQPVFAWLVIVSGTYEGHIFRLNPETTVIGRDAETCDYVIDDATVSLQHCKIKAEKPEEEIGNQRGSDVQFFVYDLATTNGTKVNGRKILRHALRDGDRIEIGQTTLVFKEV